MDHDNVNHPSHYTQYNGIEIIDLTEQMNFNKGNAVKYITRAGFKPDADEIEDLRKAIWYLTREIQRVANFAAENLTTKLNGIEQQYFVGVNPDKVKYRHSVICPCGVMSQESSSIPDACPSCGRRWRPAANDDTEKSDSAYDTPQTNDEAISKPKRMSENLTEKLRSLLRQYEADEVSLNDARKKMAMPMSELLKIELKELIKRHDDVGDISIDDIRKKMAMPKFPINLKIPDGKTREDLMVAEPFEPATRDRPVVREDVKHLPHWAQEAIMAAEKLRIAINNDEKNIPYLSELETKDEVRPRYSSFVDDPDDEGHTSFAVKCSCGNGFLGDTRFPTKCPVCSREW